MVARMSKTAKSEFLFFYFFDVFIRANSWLTDLRKTTYGKDLQKSLATCGDH